MTFRQNNRLTWTIRFFCMVALALTATINAHAQDEGEVPAPELLELETSDGVMLSAHYYPGTREKESIPVILLHAWEKDHTDIINIAGTLQKQFGYAVIVPDLRGHGQSLKNSAGEDLDRDRWRAEQIGAVIEDIEACKNFLIQKNNEGALNIDMLSVVADKQLAIFASTWTLRDWSFAPLGSMKQGQDVKALILLNPARNFKGINGSEVYRNDMYTGRIGAGFPILIASDRDGSRDARNIHKGMMAGRKSLEGSNKHIRIMRFGIEQRRRMIKERGKDDRPLDAEIGRFLETEVFNRRHDFRWAERGNK